MNKDLLDKAFAELISQRGIHHTLGISSGDVRNFRYKLKKGIAIKMDTKLQLLQKSGWQQDDRVYNRQDLIALLRFYERTSKAAREEGPEYVIEKWERSR